MAIKPSTLSWAGQRATNSATEAGIYIGRAPGLPSAHQDTLVTLGDLGSNFFAIAQRNFNRLIRYFSITAQLRRQLTRTSAELTGDVFVVVVVDKR